MRIGLLPFLLLAAVAQAAPSRQQELDDLRGRIQSLQQEIEQANEGRTEAADSLRKSERRISDVNRGLRKLEVRQHGLADNLKQLGADSVRVEGEISEQQQRLAALLRDRYAQGDSDAMKLLLNGQDPNEVARNLEYYGYIGRARSDLIRRHQASLAQLQQLQDLIRQKHAAIDQVKSERLAQKKALEAEKLDRQQVLQKFADQIQRQRKQIDTLVRDEKRLTRLIERLAKLAATKTRPDQKVDRVADASLAGLNFERLKGRLALPVAGKIRNRYGQAREQGGPAWRGLFIDAKQGLEVHAVGSGKVAFADWLRGFGNLLIIDHGDGYLSLYSNNESLYKQPGETVRAGDVVASVGATGGQQEPGLYFELRHQGKPFDPLSWVKLK